MKKGQQRSQVLVLTREFESHFLALESKVRTYFGKIRSICDQQETSLLARIQAQASRVKGRLARLARLGKGRKGERKHKKDNKENKEEKETQKSREVVKEVHKQKRGHRKKPRKDQSIWDARHPIWRHLSWLDFQPSPWALPKPRLIRRDLRALSHLQLKQVVFSPQQQADSQGKQVQVSWRVEVLLDGKQPRNKNNASPTPIRISSRCGNNNNNNNNNHNDCQAFRIENQLFFPLTSTILQTTLCPPHTFLELEARMDGQVPSAVCLKWRVEFPFGGCTAKPIRGSRENVWMLNAGCLTRCILESSKAVFCGVRFDLVSFEFVEILDLKTTHAAKFCVPKLWSTNRVVWISGRQSVVIIKAHSILTAQLDLALLPSTISTAACRKVRFPPGDRVFEDSCFGCGILLYGLLSRGTESSEPTHFFVANLKALTFDLALAPIPLGVRLQSWAMDFKTGYIYFVSSVTTTSTNTSTSSTSLWRMSDTFENTALLDNEFWGKKICVFVDGQLYGQNPGSSLWKRVFPTHTDALDLKFAFPDCEMRSSSEALLLVFKEQTWLFS